LEEGESDQETSSLLPQKRKDGKVNLSSLKRSMTKTNELNVAETVIPGLEDVPEVDSTPKRKQRKELKHELEKEFLQPAFITRNLERTQTKDSIWGIFGSDRASRIAGVFTGGIEMYEKSKAPPTSEVHTKYKRQDLVVRLYILQGHHLTPQDDDTDTSDAYIEINNGKRGGAPNIIDKAHVIKQTIDPEFYQRYDVNLTVPSENPILAISVWDEDKYTGDDLIGTTEIDIENRWFSDEWQKYKKKPIERRTLWNPTSKLPQGIVSMYVDILTPEQARKTPPDDISRPRPENWSLRVVVWETKEIVFKDDKGIISGPMSDIFLSCRPERLKKQLTDIHYRSENGKGSFNWRMVWDLELNEKGTRYPKFNVQIWDSDMVNPNDAICEANLNFRGLYKKAYKTKKAQSIDKQWIVMTHPNYEGPQGKVLISLDLLPEAEARQKPVGLGRSEPNQFPVLPKPDRPDTSFGWWRVDKYFKNVLWRKYRWYVLGCCVCLVLIILIPLIIYLRGFF